MTTDVATAPETAAAKKPTTLKQLLMDDAVKRQIAVALPKHMNPDRMARVAMTQLLQNKKLAACTQESFMRCMLACSAMGIEPDGRLAHLIPYGNECTLIIDYKGLVALARRSGTVANIHADVVCDNDEFEYDCGEITRHKINFRKPRGNVFAVYVQVVFKDGTKQCEVLSREDVEAVRKRSRAAGNGPWVTDWNEMAKKTAFRRLSKWLELSPEYRDALAVDDDPQVSGDVIDTTLASPKTLELNSMLNGVDDGEPDVSEPVNAADERVARFRARIESARDDAELTVIFEDIEQTGLPQEVEDDLHRAAIARQEELADVA